MRTSSSQGAESIFLCRLSREQCLKLCHTLFQTLNTPFVPNSIFLPTTRRRRVSMPSHSRGTFNLRFQLPQMTGETLHANLC